MAIVRRIARPLLSSIFIYGGWDALRNPEAKAPKADNLIAGLAEKLPGVTSTADVVRVDAAVKVGAGALLALGRFPRLSALALAGSLIPTTLAGHRFWEETDPAVKKGQALQFAKNASILGGVLLAAVDTHGKPSVAWRTKRAARDLRDSVSDTAHSASATIQEKAQAAADLLPSH